MFKTFSFFILLSLLLSSCGYHLRGSVDLPEGLKHIYLSGASSELTSAMKKTLKFSGGQVVNKLQNAGAVVQVLDEDMGRRVLSLSSTGRANEYELNYILKFKLLNAKQHAISKLQTLEITRDYFNDQEQVLAKNNEEQVIRAEIYRNAVQTILSRTRSALEKNTAP